MTIKDLQRIEHDFALRKITYKHEKKTMKKKLHKNYLKHNKTKIKFMDILMVFVILFNLGAVIMTNLVVVKVEPEKSFVEANQVQCKWNGYACAEPEQSKKLMNSILKQSILWTVMIALYLWYRKDLFTDEGFYLTGMIVLFYFVMTGYDFFWDLGFYLGKVIWGV